MSGQTSKQRPHMISIYEPTGTPGELVFTFVPRAEREGRPPDEPPGRAPQFIVWVRTNGDGISFDWGKTRDDPAEAKPDLERQVRQRIEERTAWVNLVSGLVSDVELWGKEIGWSTRRIDKQLEDARIGKHKLPALLMQESTVRVLLEPVSRAVPGGEGLAELSVIPTYDDIASLYFRQGGWYLQYTFPDMNAVAKAGSAEEKPLSRDTLALVLEEMKKHGCWSSSGR